MLFRSASLAPTKRQLSAVDRKKDAYKKAFVKLRTMEVMYGLTGIALTFATENSLTIQMAGLDGAASLTANASTTSGSNKEIVSGDTVMGDDTTTAVPEGSQGTEVPPAKRMEHPNPKSSKTGNESPIQEMERGESSASKGCKALEDTAVWKQLSDNVNVSYNIAT